MKDFKAILDANYTKRIEQIERQMGDVIPSITKIEYLGETVFDFITYDSEMTLSMSHNMLEVLNCILNSKTFEYIKDKTNYINYLNMVNTPFLIDKLEWGTSIRGAWLDDTEQHTIPLLGKEGGVPIEQYELSVFIKDILEWVN